MFDLKLSEKESKCDSFVTWIQHKIFRSHQALQNRLLKGMVFVAHACGESSPLLLLQALHACLKGAFHLTFQIPAQTFIPSLLNRSLPPLILRVHRLMVPGMTKSNVCLQTFRIKQTELFFTCGFLFSLSQIQILEPCGSMDSTSDVPKRQCVNIRHWKVSSQSGHNEIGDCFDKSIHFFRFALRCTYCSCCALSSKHQLVPSGEPGSETRSSCHRHAEAGHLLW